MEKWLCEWFGSMSNARIFYRALPTYGSFFMPDYITPAKFLGFFAVNPTGICKSPLSYIFMKILMGSVCPIQVIVYRSNMPILSINPLGVLNAQQLPARTYVIASPFGPSNAFKNPFHFADRHHHFQL